MIGPTNYTNAILHINPDAKFMMWENDPERIVWNDAQHTGVKPTREECDTAWAEMTEPDLEPIVYDVPVIAPDFIVQSPRVKDDPLEALDEAVTEAKKAHGTSKSIALIVLSLAKYAEDLEKRAKKKGL